MISLPTSNPNSRRGPGTRLGHVRLFRIFAACAGLHLATVSASDDSPDAPQVYTSWRTFTTADGLPNNAIRTLQACDHAVWAGTDDGLAVFAGDHWQSWTTKDGLPARRVQCIDIDPHTGDVWIGTLGGGLARLTAGRFDVFNQFNSGLAGNLVFAVAVCKGRVWTSTNGGISAYDYVTDHWELSDERRSDAPFHAAARFMCEAEDLYAEFQRIGIRKWNEAAAQWISIDRRTAPISLSTGVTMVDSLRDGLRLSTGNADGTEIHYQHDPDGPGGRVTLVRAGRAVDAHTTLDGIPNNRVRCVESYRSEIWVGTADGIAVGSNPVRWNDVSRVTSRRASSPAPTVTPKTTPADPERSASNPAIAVFGPRTRRIALPGDESPSRAVEVSPDLLAVQLATESVNARGGFRQTGPFQLVTAAIGYANYGWSLPEDDLIVFAENTNVIGLVAYAPPDATITDTAIVSVELPVVSPDADLFKTGDARNPWVFRCHGDEPSRHRLLLDYLVEKRKCTRLAIIETDGDSARPPTCWWTRYARNLKLPTPLELSWDPAKPEQLDALVRALHDSDAQAVLTWCDSGTATALIRQFRAAGLDQLFVAHSDIIADQSLTGAGLDVGAVITMAASSPARPAGGEQEARRFNESSDPENASVGRSKRSIDNTNPSASEGTTEIFAQFIRRYAEQNVTGRERTVPDLNARRSFDAADHLLAAVGPAGANREAVRETLAIMETNPFGEDHFERMHGPCTVEIARLESGRWVYETVSPKVPSTPPTRIDSRQSPESNRP